MGATILSRYSVLWDDAAGPGKQQLSNAQRLILSDTTRNDTSGAVEPFNTATLSVASGDKVTIMGDFYTPNKIVSLWYTDKDGKSISLGQEIADKDGKLSFELIAGSDLVAGESYSVVGYGNRS